MFIVCSRPLPSKSSSSVHRHYATSCSGQHAKGFVTSRMLPRIRCSPFIIVLLVESHHRPSPPHEGDRYTAHASGAVNSGAVVLRYAVARPTTPPPLNIGAANTVAKRRKCAQNPAATPASPSAARMPGATSARSLPVYVRARRLCHVRARRRFVAHC